MPTLAELEERAARLPTRGTPALRLVRDLLAYARDADAQLLAARRMYCERSASTTDKLDRIYMKRIAVSQGWDPAELWSER